MAIAFVQKSAAVAVASGLVLTPTLPAPSTPGNLLVLHAFQGGTRTGWEQAVSTGSWGAIWFAKNTVGGETSFAFSTGSLAMGFITEWSGVDTTSPLVTTGSVEANGTPQTATTSGIVPATGYLAIGVVVDTETKAGTTTLTPGTGWTNQLDNGSSSIAQHVLGSSILNPTSGSTLSEQGSSSSMNLIQVAVGIAIFKPFVAAAAGGIGGQQLALMGCGQM
jgi:hypothetical protein